jgi:hypothetical protein
MIMYLAKPQFNGLKQKTFALKYDAIKYLEEVTGYEMDKVTKFKGTDVTFYARTTVWNTAQDVVFTPGDMIRAEFATYDWELVGKLVEVE